MIFEFHTSCFGNSHCHLDVCEQFYIAIIQKGLESLECKLDRQQFSISWTRFLFRSRKHSSSYVICTLNYRPTCRGTGIWIHGLVYMILPTTLACSLAETCVFLSTLCNVEISFSILCAAMANLPSIPSQVRPRHVMFCVGTHTDFSSFATNPDLAMSDLTVWACCADVSNDFPCLCYRLEMKWSVCLNYASDAVA